MTSFKDLLSQRLRKLFDEKDIVKAHFAKKIDKKHENIAKILKLIKFSNIHKYLCQVHMFPISADSFLVAF